MVSESASGFSLKLISGIIHSMVEYCKADLEAIAMDRPTGFAPTLATMIGRLLKT